MYNSGKETVINTTTTTKIFEAMKRVDIFLTKFQMRVLNVNIFDSTNLFQVPVEWSKPHRIKGHKPDKIINKTGALFACNIAV